MRGWICKFGAPHFCPNLRENASFQGGLGEIPGGGIMGRSEFADPTPQRSNPPFFKT